MSGLINASAAPAAAVPQQLQTPILKEAEAKNEAGLDPANRDNYEKIVKAGLAAAMGQDGKLLRTLHNNPDPVRAAAAGTVALLMIFRSHAKGIMPIKAMAPAGLTLMLYALDFLNRSGAAKIGNAELDRAEQIFANDMFHALGITAAMIHAAAAQVHGITQDPAAMYQVNMKAGVLRHPNAATPTPLPASPPA